MAVVIGTAGHIDHGKTTLLRALTGIDPDRLPEERRRGMTIDVGYAHLDLGDGRRIDLVDVPGHDRLVGNMLVGAGEVDAALLVVAADDGPRAQTIEHLELLDALGLGDAVVAVTKVDLLPPDDPRRSEVTHGVRRLLAPTALADAPIVLVSGATGEGLDDLRGALERLAARLEPRLADRARERGRRLSVDRAFAVRGRGAVVTGSLRGGQIEPGDTLRVLPDGGEVRVREVQVHGARVESAGPGRTALNLAGMEAARLRRGLVLTADPAVVATDRLLVALRPPSGGRAGVEWWRTGGTLRLHIGTDQVNATLERSRRWSLPVSSGEHMAVLRLAAPVGAAAGDRFVLRRPSPAATVAGGRVLDPLPPGGPSRRRASPDRLAAVAAAIEPAPPAAAVLDLHGVLPLDRWRALDGSGQPPVGPLVLAPDVLAELTRAAAARIAAHHAAEPESAGFPLTELRRSLAAELRRRATASPDDALAAAGALVDGLVAAGRLARTGDRIRDPDRPDPVPAGLTAAMDRLEALVASPAPPSFAAAIRRADCPVEGVRRLEAEGRLVRLGPDLAFASSAYRELERLAVSMAAAGPVTPAAFRDATGTSRKYVLAILEDLDRRGLLVRTPEGHRLAAAARR